MGQRAKGHTAADMSSGQAADRYPLPQQTCRFRKPGLLTPHPTTHVQAMELMSAGRAARGNRSTTSPRRGRASQGGQQQQPGAGGEGGSGGRAGGGIMWADGAGDGVGLTLIEGDIEGV